ncbi:MAG TPA: methyltransferase domain-containing protein [Spirochaetota bacterium]|nr:methyltransferase domain-containing protein [Spirochaetota bacterium]HQA53676.1 methyltransferase domain-containing protein [Spirochaetota bacterium]
MDKITQNIKAYNKNASKFASRFADFEPYLNAMDDFIKLLKDNCSCLDLACGPGSFSSRIASRFNGAKITGIDISSSMIDLAKAAVPKGDFKCMNILEAEFDDAQFDAVLLSFCIVHLNRDEAISIIEKSALFLKSGGLLYISFMEGKTDGFEKTSFSDDDIYFHYHNENEIIQVIKDNSLRAVKRFSQDYAEADGSITKDVFVFAEKKL